MLKIRFYKLGDPRPVETDVGTEPSRTKQSFANECDINNIMRRYEKTGEITHINVKPLYSDEEIWTPHIDYTAAYNMLIDAQEAFDALPARVREQLDNDPAQFMDYISDENNRKFLEDEGVFLKKSGPPAAPVAPASPDDSGA